MPLWRGVVSCTEALTGTGSSNSELLAVTRPDRISSLPRLRSASVLEIEGSNRIAEVVDQMDRE